MTDAATPIAPGLTTDSDKKQKMNRLTRATREAIVERLNKDHALILLGNQPAVLREGLNEEGREEVQFLPVAAFHEWKRPDVVWLNSGDDGPDKRVQASKIWIESPLRRQFEGLVFDPRQLQVKDYYNLWKGFAMEPAPSGTQASCQLFIDHVADNICSGDPDLFAWVMAWFAALIQEPWDKKGTSLVLRGKQGTGKTKAGEVVGSLLGPHYALVAEPRYITGRFNAHLAHLLLLQLDEATWAGDHDAASKLKDLVTGSYQHIEFKGREPIKLRNYVRLLITSNSHWVIPAGLEERRFAVLDVGDGKRQDAAFFKALDDQMDNGGRAALLRYLMDFDLSDIPIRSIPETAALSDQRMASLSPEQHWWLDILMGGMLPGDAEGTGTTEVSALFNHYLAQSQRLGINRRSWETSLGRALRKWVPGLKKDQRTVHTPGGTDRPMFYFFPSLAACRREFEKVVGGEWWGSETEASWRAWPVSGGAK